MFRSMKGEKKPKMLSPRQFASKHAVAYTTVLFWLKNEAVQGAEKVPLPFGEGRYAYQIPEDAPKPDLKPGPVPKKAETKPAKKRAARKAGN
jgi:hypothetical protein